MRVMITFVPEYGTAEAWDMVSITEKEANTIKDVIVTIYEKQQAREDKQNDRLKNDNNA